MNPDVLPWLELSIVVPLVGAAVVGLIRDPVAAWGWCLGFAGAALACAVLVWAGQYTGRSPDGSSPHDLLPRVLGVRVLEVDELSAPLLPLVALLHFLTALATARTKAARFSFGWMLRVEALRLATFGCKDPWVLIGLLIAAPVLKYAELRRQGKPGRVFALHMGLFAVLLVAGWAGVEGVLPVPAGWAAVLVLLAVLIRCGTVPAHAWVTDLFDKASFGTALLFAVPLPGVYAAVRLVLPVAPEWALEGLGVVSLATAVYAAGMAVVQTEARRFFAFLFLSHASLVLVGLELHTPLTLTGALALWFSVALSLTGLGLTLRALEARFGRVSLDRFHGLYDQAPALAVCFLLAGLASVGFPGTLGFVAAELLVDGVVGANLAVGVLIALAAAVNGIAVVRAYFLLFAGGRHVSSVPLGITRRERVAVLILAGLILGGGLLPQPGVTSRSRAAEAVLRDRETRLHGGGPDSPGHGPGRPGSGEVERGLP